MREGRYVLERAGPVQLTVFTAEEMEIVDVLALLIEHVEAFNQLSAAFSIRLGLLEQRPELLALELA